MSYDQQSADLLRENFALRAKLSASEAECERLRREAEVAWSDEGDHLADDNKALRSRIAQLEAALAVCARAGCPQAKAELERVTK